MLLQNEIEYKFLVDKETFDKLLLKCNLKFEFSKQRLHANYYYDTYDNFFNKKNVTVRIRQHLSDMILQIKNHIIMKNGLSCSDEHSVKIETLPSVLKISDVYEPIILKGMLVTERKIYQFGKNSKICFDASMYLGVCDYELEFEMDEMDEEIAINIISFLKLKSVNHLNKSNRFFKRLEEMQNEQGDVAVC